MRSPKQQAHSFKHIPQRTCVACRQTKSKRELVRLIRIADGGVEIDVTGKKAGRGAYLCPAQECWQIGLKGRQLEHALRTSLTQNNRDQLIRYGESLTAKGEQIWKESVSGKGE